MQFELFKRPWAEPVCGKNHLQFHYAIARVGQKRFLDVYSTLLPIVEASILAGPRLGLFQEMGDGLNFAKKKLEEGRLLLSLPGTIPAGWKCARKIARWKFDQKFLVSILNFTMISSIAIMAYIQSYAENAYGKWIAGISYVSMTVLETKKIVQEIKQFSIAAIPNQLGVDVNAVYKRYRIYQVCKLSKYFLSLAGMGLVGYQQGREKRVSLQLAAILVGLGGVLAGWSGELVKEMSAHWIKVTS